MLLTELKWSKYTKYQRLEPTENLQWFFFQVINFFMTHLYKSNTNILHNAQLLFIDDWKKPI